MKPTFSWYIKMKTPSKLMAIGILVWSQVFIRSFKTVVTTYQGCFLKTQLQILKVSAFIDGR